MTEEWEDSFNTIKSLHDEAYRTVEQAIKHEENSQPSLVHKLSRIHNNLIKIFSLQ